MLLNTILIFIVLFSAGYFVFRAIQNTNSLLKKRDSRDQNFLDREEIERLIESELEKRIYQLQDEIQQQASYEDDEDYEKNTNNNTFPALKVVK